MSADSTPVRNERFRSVEQIGSGQYGTIFRAYDDETRDVVALKVLRSATATDGAALKQEFRVLRQIVHPNVVRFHELFTSAEPWFYTMECIAGRRLDDWWSSQTDEKPLAHVAEQLLPAVDAIHASGAVHRDLKPANLLVADDGRLTIVDFGFAHSTLSRSQWQRPDAAGTFAYMAPEAMLGQIGPASDWYSVGAILFELVCGELPEGREEPDIRALLDKASAALSVDDLPVARGIGGLLDADAGRRLQHARELLRSLSDRSEVRAPSSSQAPFVGRAPQIERLRQALRDSRRSGQVCHVHGPSGIGKTELVARFLDEARGQGAVVLQGRCHTTERVPYNALDEAVDDLARLLEARASTGTLELPADEEGRSAAARLFPVLASIRGFDGEVNVEASPQRLRRLGIEALRALLAGVGEHSAFVLWLDDVQWGDAESSVLLNELLPAGSTRVLLLLSYRSPEADDGPFVPALALDSLERTNIEVSPLDSDAITEWIAGAAPAARQADWLRYVTENADGSPFLVTELLRSAAASGEFARVSTLDAMLAERLAALSPDERVMLELAAVSARPMDCRVLGEAAVLPGGAQSVAEHLAARSLLRIRIQEQRAQAIVYHDRIRESLFESLGEDRRRAHHLSLARAIEGSNEPDPEHLFVHWLGGGETLKAGRCAESAARRASDALAFDRAARLLRESLALGGDATDHARRTASLGDALINGGRGYEGAKAYEEAAAAVERLGNEPGNGIPSRQDLYSRAAQHLVRSGRMVEGKELITRLLGEVGVSMPASADRAMREALLRRVRFLFRGYECRPCERSDLSESERRRIDLLWDSAMCFNLTNFPIAHALLSTHLLQCLDGGDRWSVMRAVGTEAAFEAAIGTPWLRRRAMKMMDFVDSLVRPELDDLYWMQSVRIFRSICCWNQGIWKESAVIADEYATKIQRHCPGRDWEVAVGLLHLFGALAYMGEYRQLSERMPAALADAAARGDDFAVNFYRLGEQALVFLALDQPAELRRQIDLAKASWPNEPHHLHHYHHVVIETYLALYEGRFDDAWDFIQQKWPMLKEAQFLAIEIGRITFHHLRARAALGLARSRIERASRERDPQVRALTKDVERSLKVIRRSKLPPAPGYASQLACGLADLRGDAAGAVRAAFEAADAYDRADMPIYAAACRWKHGNDGQRADAESAIRAQAVVDVERMVRTLVPG